MVYECFSSLGEFLEERQKYMSESHALSAALRNRGINEINPIISYGGAVDYACVLRLESPHYIFNLIKEVIKEKEERSKIKRK